MKIGIFGGSFNPPHRMHKYIADEILNKHIVDKIFYVPTGSKYKYKNNLAPDKARYEMVKLMISKDKRLEISDYELKNKVVYTCETLAYFKKIYPNDEIYFICGTDNLSYLDKWKNGEEILKNYKILVVNRSGNDTGDLLEKFSEYKDNIIVAPVNLRDLSSTEIRMIIQKGNYEELKNYLDEDVIKYIIKERLYVV